MRHAVRGCLAVLLILASTNVLVRAADAPKPTAPPEPADMKPLLNGKNLDGWDGEPGLWTFKDGVVHGETTSDKPIKGNTFLIWKGGEPGDFELRLSFKLTNHNSGVQYRSKQLPKDPQYNPWGMSGYQAEIDNTPGKAGYLYHEKGGLVGRSNPLQMCFVGDKTVIDADGKRNVTEGALGKKDDLAATYKSGDWNDYVIIARGNHIVHYLNGIQTIDFTDNDAKASLKSGVIGLQMHAGQPMVVEFKNIRLKEYPASNGSAQ